MVSGTTVARPRRGTRNNRLVALQNGQVTFRWKDRAHGNAPRLATLDAPTFLRRFLLHVLPSHFVRIRHYGLLANSVRREKLPKVRELLGQPAAAPRSPAPKEPEPWEAMVLRLAGEDVSRCPRCGAEGFLIVEADAVALTAGADGVITCIQQIGQ